LLTAATAAGAAEPVTATERDKAVMLYFSKAFGSTQRQNRTPMTFGLRLQENLSFAELRPVALFDARYSFGGRRQLILSGFNAFGSSHSSSGSSGDSSQSHPGWTAAAIIVGVAGTMCLLEAGICESSDHGSDYTPTPGSPTNPG